MQNNIKKKNYGVEWISEIPKGWIYLRNKYCFDLKKDIVGNKSDSYQLLSLTKYGIKEIGRDEQNGKVPESFDTYQIVDSGDIVMCLFDLDVSAVFSGICNKKGIISSAYKCLQCKEILNNRYVDYFFRTVFVDRKYKRYSKNVRYSISVDEFMDLSIVVPTINEQKSIADFLDFKCQKIDDTIEKINKQIEVLKKYKQSVITEVATKGLDKNAEMKDSGVDWIGKIPKGWEVKRLKYTCKQRSEKNSLEKELDYFALENIESWNFRYIETENEYDISESNICKKDDVVFGKLRPYLAKTFLVDYDRCCSSEFVVFYDFCGLQKFLLYILTSYGFVTIVDSSTYGTKMPRANVEFIKNMRIPLPELNEQEKIVSYLDKKCERIDNILDKKSKQIETLEKYKKSLIYEYVTGKKRVKENRM